jgi:hypothetical protein
MIKLNRADEARRDPERSINNIIERWRKLTAQAREVEQELAQDQDA